MSKKDNYRSSNNYDHMEDQKPAGWFDPQDYSRNRQRYSESNNMDNDYPSSNNSRNDYRNYEDNMRMGYTRGQDPHSGFPRYASGNNNQRSGNENRNSNRIQEDNNYPNNSNPINYRGRENDNPRNRNNSNVQDRDWWDRTSDEVASWFGDDDAERRRRMDKVSGPHIGKGPKGYTRTNERIKEDINEKFYHDSHLDASDIDISINEGEVTLSGTVNTREQKRRAEDLAERVGGVNDVQNQLKVNKGSNVTESTNERYGQKSDN
ncbi:MAG: BON domain-containing protein [Ferruginibacter sp.]